MNYLALYEILQIHKLTSRLLLRLRKPRRFWWPVLIFHDQNECWSTLCRWVWLQSKWRERFNQIWKQIKPFIKIGSSIAQLSKSINGESLKPFGTCRTVDFWIALSVQKWSSLPTGRVRWWTINCNYVASKMLVTYFSFSLQAFGTSWLAGANVPVNVKEVENEWCVLKVCVRH